jgi:NitT/TauT family transport system substrate-binding protein
MRLLIFILILLTPILARADTKLVFATNWVAQPEHGGFYQALSDGEYKKCGLNVEIIQGGPGSNNRAKLITNKIDLYMGGNLIQLINSRAEGVPIKTIAAFFQKDPQIIISHPEGTYSSWTDLLNADPIYISDMGLVTFFRWMEKEHNFDAEKRRPYLFNSAPFLADENSAQQGYLTSEPYSIKKEIGVEPNVFLLADYGFDASKIGWKNYLHGDASKTNELIKRENPDITDAKIKYSMNKLKEYGIVETSDTQKFGIGYFSAEKIRKFYKQMLEFDVVKELDDINDIYTEEFIHK